MNIIGKRARLESTYSGAKDSKSSIKSMALNTTSTKRVLKKRIRTNTSNIGNAIMKNIGTRKRIMLTISSQPQLELGSN